ncbi:hypothetical protein D3C86_1248670 [compost metagenome]
MKTKIQQAEEQLASLQDFLLGSKPKMTGAEINVLKVNLEAVKARRLRDIREHHEEE